MVFGYPFVAHPAPMEYVFYNVEHILNLASDAGFASLELLFCFPCQTAAIMAFERTPLSVDPIVVSNPILYIAIQFAVTGIPIDYGIARSYERRCCLNLGCVGWRSDHGLDIPIDGVCTYVFPYAKVIIAPFF